MKKLSLFVVLAIMIACNPNNPQEVTIIVNPSEVNAPVEGGEYTLQVTCENAWRAVIGDSWIVLSQTEGEGDTEVTLTVNPNNWVENDTASIMFTDEKSDAEVKIYREGKGENTIVVSPTSVGLGASGGSFELEITSNTTWAVNSNVSWVTYSPGVGKNNGVVRVTVAPATEYELTIAVLTVSEYGTENKDNKTDVIINRDGKPSPYFNVLGKKILFSPGNLQYQASTKIWRFAEHQYDIIGEDNKNISDTYSGWIDMFGWGTGNNPIVTSTNVNDYKTFTDWGINPISNGGNEANQWRTLTYHEWNTLTTSAGYKSGGKATVNEIRGYVLMPDGWVRDGSFIPGADDWSTNQYSVEKWENLESMGAVFLPIGGHRTSTTMFLYDSGDYWSSSQVSAAGLAYYYTFQINDVSMSSDYCYGGRYVRLVKDVTE